MATAKQSRSGRKAIQIDPKVVEGMARVGATNVEIGEFVGCSADTVARRFAEVLTKARAGMKTKLRRAQMKLALAGNATMLIWLGKQMLGQSDRPEDPDSDSGRSFPTHIDVCLVSPDGTRTPI